MNITKKQAAKIKELRAAGWKADRKEYDGIKTTMVMVKGTGVLRVTSMGVAK